MSVKKLHGNGQLKLDFDQVPHVIRNHPLMTNDAESVFISLYKILKNKPKCTYSNGALSTASRVSLRTLDNCLTLLEKIGAITRTGLKQNRKFGRGLLLIAVQQEPTSAPNADVNKKDPDTQLNTSANGAYACANAADAYAGDAHILIPTIKNSTTNTPSVVVVISESKDKQLRDAYEKYKDDLQSEDIRSAQDLLNYCKWSMNKAKTEGVNEEGRFKQIIKFLKAGTLRIDYNWSLEIKRNKKRMKIGITMGYQEYTTRMQADISLGILPKDTEILEFEEWRLVNEN